MGREAVGGEIRLLSSDATASTHSTSFVALLNPNLKDTIECAKKIVKGKHGMGAW